MFSKSLFGVDFLSKNFGDSHQELNKRLIQDIDTEMSFNKSLERSFAKNNCSWQSAENLNKRYDSFYELGEIIKEHSGYDKIDVWANVILKPGGFSRPHTHGPHLNLTGVYYPHDLYDDYDDNEDVVIDGWNKDEGVLVLFDPNSMSRGFNKVQTIKPRESLLVLFPCYVPHMVSPMISNKRRYCISFKLNNKKK